MLEFILLLIAVILLGLRTFIIADDRLGWGGVLTFVLTFLIDAWPT